MSEYSKYLKPDRNDLVVGAVHKDGAGNMVELIEHCREQEFLPYTKWESDRDTDKYDNITVSWAWQCWRARVLTGSSQGQIIKSKIHYYFGMGHVPLKPDEEE